MVRQDEVFFQLQDGPRAAALTAASGPAAAARLRMQRVTSRQNPRLKAAERLLASARDRRKAGSACSRASTSSACTPTATAPPETLVVAEDFLDAALGAARWRSAHADRTLVVPATLFAELAVLPAGVGMLAVVPVPPQPRHGADRLLPAARRRAGSRQRRLDAALGGGRRRHAGAAVEALRVRVVAEGAARREGRALPPRHRTRTSTCRRGRPLHAPAAASWSRRSPRAASGCSTRRCGRASRSRSATRARGCRRRSPRRRRCARRSRCPAAWNRSTPRPRRPCACSSGAPARAVTRRERYCRIAATRPVSTQLFA